MEIKYNNTYVLKRVRKSSPVPYFLTSRVNKQGELKKIYWTKDVNKADRFETINQLVNFISSNKITIKPTERVEVE